MPKGTRRPLTKGISVGGRGRGHATKNSDKTQAYRTKKDNGKRGSTKRR